MYVTLVEHCMKWTLLTGLKGSNYNKKPGKAYKFRLKLKTE